MKVLVYPHYSANPYQQSLYEALARQGNEIKYIESSRLNLTMFPAILFAERCHGYKIFHLHWPNFYTTFPKPIAKQLSFLLTLLSLIWLRVFNFKVVWTIHNVLPHETQTSDDIKIAQYLSQRADAKIVHSHFTVNEMKKLKLNVGQVTIIPHGNYIGVYPEKITRKKARQRLGIDKDEIVILFFGMIRTYKGVDDLISSFTRLNKRKVRLVIAGKCIDEALKQKIIVGQRDHSIDFYEGHVADNDVAMYFKACDVVCLPFKSITTSGSALLALSFGKPIIAPRSGALHDIPNSVGYLYDPEEPYALSKSLARAIEEKAKLKKKGESALEYAKTLNWDDIAEKTYKVYQEVLGRPANDKS